jgi:hypothetical protein
MKKYVATKIKKVREAIFQALCYADEEEFDLEFLKKNIYCNYKLSFGVNANSYKIEIKGFSICFYAQKGDTENYVEIIPIIGKNPLNKHFAIWLTESQFEKLLNELTK